MIYLFMKQLRLAVLQEAVRLHECKDVTSLIQVFISESKKLESALTIIQLMKLIMFLLMPIPAKLPLPSLLTK